MDIRSNELYNAKQKLQYINTLPEAKVEKTYDNMVNFFKRLNEVVESKYNQDFSELDYDSVKTAISLLGGRNRQTIAWNMSKLKKYIDWCIINGRTSRTDNVMKYITSSEIDNTYTYTQSMIKDPDHLRRIMDTALPDVRLKHPNNITRLFIWLVYKGFTDKEAVEIKRNDVFMVNKTIVYNKKEMQIDDDLLPLIEQIIEDGTFYFMMRGFVQEKSIIPSEYLLSSIRPSNGNRLNHFRDKLTKLSVSYGETIGEKISLSAGRLFDSGVFYRWYKKELIHEEITEEHIVDYINDKGLNPFYISSEIKKIKMHYETWKKAFELAV
jgi:hypothetical protein